LSFVKQKVIVSACLLGEYCRYDGKTKKDELVIEKLQKFEIIPFCPEAPVFGTPRQRIKIVEHSSEMRVVVEDSGKDVTAILKSEIQNFIEQNPFIDRIVLKSKSPSCGYKTTPIQNLKNNEINFGNGVATEMFLKHYGDIIEDELILLQQK